MVRFLKQDTPICRGVFDSVGLSVPANPQSDCRGRVKDPENETTNQNHLGLSVSLRHPLCCLCFKGNQKDNRKPPFGGSYSLKKDTMQPSFSRSFLSK